MVLVILYGQQEAAQRGSSARGMFGLREFCKVTGTAGGVLVVARRQQHLQAVLRHGCEGIGKTIKMVDLVIVYRQQDAAGQVLSAKGGRCNLS